MVCQLSFMNNKQIDNFTEGFLFLPKKKFEKNPIKGHIKNKIRIYLCENFKSKKMNFVVKHHRHHFMNLPLGDR